MKKCFACFALLVTALFIGATVQADIIDYEILSATGASWSGSFDVVDSAGVVDDGVYANFNTVSINEFGGASVGVNYFGSNSSGFLNFSGAPNGLEFWSPEVYAIVQSSGTWDQLLAVGTFNLSVEMGEDSVFKFGGTDIATGNGGTISVSSPVPEPATTLLLGIGLAGLASLRRRTKE